MSDQNRLTERAEAEAFAALDAFMYMAGYACQHNSARAAVLRAIYETPYGERALAAFERALGLQIVPIEPIEEVTK